MSKPLTDIIAEADAGEIRLRAERKLGELLREAPKATGAMGTGSNQHEVRYPSGTAPTPPTLADQGIDKKPSSRAQKMAAVPEYA